MLKGFGFCEFESSEGILRALRLLHKVNIDGQELVGSVNLSLLKGFYLLLFFKWFYMLILRLNRQAPRMQELVQSFIEISLEITLIDFF